MTKWRTTKWRGWWPWYLTKSGRRNMRAAKSLDHDPEFQKSLQSFLDGLAPEGGE